MTTKEAAVLAQELWPHYERLVSALKIIGRQGWDRNAKRLPQPCRDPEDQEIGPLSERDVCYGLSKLLGKLAAIEGFYVSEPLPLTEGAEAVQYGSLPLTFCPVTFDISQKYREELTIVCWCFPV